MEWVTFRTKHHTILWEIPSILRVTKKISPSQISHLLEEFNMKRLRFWEQFKFWIIYLIQYPYSYFLFQISIIRNLSYKIPVFKLFITNHLSLSSFPLSFNWVKRKTHLGLNWMLKQQNKFSCWERLWDNEYHFVSKEIAPHDTYVCCIFSKLRLGALILRSVCWLVSHSACLSSKNYKTITKLYKTLQIITTHLRT